MPTDEETTLTTSPPSVSVRKDEATRLYEALVDGRVVGELAYETTGGRVSLTHSYVDPAYRHQGVASSLARFALEDLNDGEQKVDVYCGFVADYVRDHPEFSTAAEVHRSSLIATRMEANEHRGGQ